MYMLGFMLQMLLYPSRVRLEFGLLALPHYIRSVGTTFRFTQLQDELSH